ncbi:Sugar kinase of the NBD/HSP70 family, may contain an N-terminal HTH domain [Paenibacillus sp. UNC496MF]|uniref:ROK family transcriptional regulator n=1 Tax=Paenibacillus sp. UNC496MF TaxID=1502753 RepID=UPI0008E4CBFB|nr:ROK family transcriptional regulator [Paenibacillus sp. UNC496MF]SFJ34834.1 Sugar kinase of the NBD/HSP70 family, may contain an N-terminal HTH domain [Paenibacillus sp. UNC496MF]
MTNLFMPNEIKEPLIYRIRAGLIMMGSATKAELSQRLGISFPTISKCIAQMERDGEIRYTGDDDSSGGRRAKRYAYDPEYMLGLAVFIEKDETHYSIFNCIGEIKAQGSEPSVIRENAQLLAELIEGLIEQYPRLRSIAIGVPGAVNNGKIIFIPPYHNFLHYDLKGEFESRFQIPVVVENDMNASVLGYASNFEIENESLVYLYFGQNGPGSGIMINGQVVRGNTFFSGEISFVPQYDTQSFSDALYMEKRESRIVLAGDKQLDAVARLIAAFAAIINPRAVVFCDDEVDEARLASIADLSSTYIPREHLPLLVSSDWRQDYLTGLQQLALHLMITDG